MFVGSDDGMVHAFEATNGASSWAAIVGGVPSSPAVVSGKVFVAAEGNLAQAYRLTFAGCAPSVTKITCDNRLPGSPASQWDVPGSGDPSIQGFATDMSVDVAETVHFKINTPSTAYHVDIYRMGYYGGLGARKVTTLRPSVALPQRQPACCTTRTQDARLRQLGRVGVVGGTGQCAIGHLAARL